MKLENVVPWGRNLQEYQNMFLLSNQDLQSKILGCGDGPSSFNFEATKQHAHITSIDSIYQFTKDEIQQRIDETSSVVSEQLKQNQKSEHLEPILKVLNDRGFETKIITTNYEFQKGANEMLTIRVYNNTLERNIMFTIRK